MMKKLGTYELTGHLTSQNSGYSIWGFGKKNGKNYFIKQFLSPKYPENDTMSSPERLQKKIKQCERFELQKTAIYRMLNDNSDGNAVRVEEFFRIDSKYYISMRKIEALPWDVAMIKALDQNEIRRLCAIIAHGVAGLHKGHIVHADLKHDNILFMRTEMGAITAKIIDFDSSFLETDPPAAGDEIIGDLVYFSPEACRSIWGEEVKLTCKMDIFSLGVLFHQYFTGELPQFDIELSDYPGEAVAKGEHLSIAESLPEDISILLTSMMNFDPDQRPSAMEVFSVLANWEVEEPEKSQVVTSDEITSSCDTIEFESDAIERSTTRDNPFFRPGNL